MNWLIETADSGLAKRKGNRSTKRRKRKEKKREERDVRWRKEGKRNKCGEEAGKRRGVRGKER